MRQRFWVIWLMPLFLLSCGTVLGPTVQQMQATDCNFIKFEDEWRCIQEKIKTNPRHNTARGKEFKVGYIAYGDRLLRSVKAGSMTNATASLKLMEYADKVDAQIMAVASARASAIGNALQAAGEEMSKQQSSYDDDRLERIENNLRWDCINKGGVYFSATGKCL